MRGVLTEARRHFQPAGGATEVASVVVVAGSPVTDAVAEVVTPAAGGAAEDARERPGLSVDAAGAAVVEAEAPRRHASGARGSLPLFRRKRARSDADMGDACEHVVKGRKTEQ